jgi:demethylmenaquinone methyltransferase/2-methoxy-6-polyprenyl-1,4-benzoquinol methylase
VRRVLRPGGRYVIVESSQPRNGVIRAFFHLYLRGYVRSAGVLLSGEKGAYRYLAESAANYYSPPQVKELLLAAGFSEVHYRSLFFGAAGIHVAVR